MVLVAVLIIIALKVASVFDLLTKYKKLSIEKQINKACMLTITKGLLLNISE